MYVCICMYVRTYYVYTHIYLYIHISCIYTYIYIHVYYDIEAMQHHEIDPRMPIADKNRRDRDGCHAS